jgi:hypothetical protein
LTWCSFCRRFSDAAEDRRDHRRHDPVRRVGWARVRRRGGVKAAAWNDSGSGYLLPLEVAGSAWGSESESARAFKRPCVFKGESRIELHALKMSLICLSQSTALPVIMKSLVGMIWKRNRALRQKAAAHKGMKVTMGAAPLPLVICR